MAVIRYTRLVVLDQHLSTHIYINQKDNA